MNEVRLTEVSSPGCHNCAAFKTFWDSIKGDWPNVIFEEISLTDERGQELVQKHQIFASPGIILNDQLFSTGGINKDAFLARLKEISGV